MKRSGSSLHQYRKRIPADVLRVVRGKRASVVLPSDRPGADPIHVAFTWGAEVRFSLQTRDPAVAKRRNAAVSEQFEELFSIARAGPPPVAPLTTKQIAALAGDAYNAFAVGLEDNPVLSPEQWKAVQAAHEADLIAEPSPLGIYQTKADYEDARQFVREANLERRYGVIADAVLAYRMRSTDGGSRKLLLREIARVSINATGKLARNADGDYSPDSYAARFPEWTAAARSAQTSAPIAMSLDTLMLRWAVDGEKSRRSLSAFRGVVKAFKLHLGHGDASRVTKADVRAWRDALASKGLSAKSIN
ncbi:MAG: site-specific integrase, partial [Hyphomicrobium sp.]|nr:site-specific integrase [Hyphomicrobium sp.]